MFHCNTGTKTKNITFLTLGIMQLWRPQKMTNFLTPIPIPHLQNWTIDMLFKNNRICKHVTNFKTSWPPFCVDIINVWSLIENNFLNGKLRERLETSKVKSFISFCYMFFWFAPKNIIYMIRIKKQNVLHDWGEVF